MKVALLLCLLIVFGQGTSLNGQDTNARLKADMKSIQDGLNEHHQVSYVVSSQDPRAARGPTERWVIENSNFVADESSCTISYVLAQQRNGIASPAATNSSLKLKDVDEISVAALKEILEREGVQYRVEPSVYALLLHRNVPPIGLYSLIVIDSKVANGLAQSMADAARLCQGRDVKLTLANPAGQAQSEDSGNPNVTNPSDIQQWWYCSGIARSLKGGPGDWAQAPHNQGFRFYTQVFKAAETNPTPGVDHTTALAYGKDFADWILLHNSYIYTDDASCTGPFKEDETRRLKKQMMDLDHGNFEEVPWAPKE